MTPVLAIHDDEEVLLLGFVATQNGYSVSAVYATHDGGLHYCELRDIRITNSTGTWPSGFLDTPELPKGTVTIPVPR